MKKLSKNTFAKLFATFLGASTILTPLVTIVSCQPISKSPTIEQQNSNQNQNGSNNQNQNNGQTGGSTGGSGTGSGQNGGGTGSGVPKPPSPPSSNKTETIKVGEASLTITKNENNEIISAKATGTITLDKITELTDKAETIDTTDLTIKSFKSKNKTDTILKVNEEDLKKVAKKFTTLNIENCDTTKQTIQLDKDANIVSIKGNISLKDIEDPKGIAGYIAKKLKEQNSFDVSKLKINTFYKVKEEYSYQTLNTASENVTWKYISTPITPSFIEETNLGSLKAAALNFKDGNQSIPVHFQSTETDFFDIKKLLHKFNFDSDFKLATESKIVLGSKAKKQTDASNKDITPYPKIHELLKLLKNEKLKNYISIKDVYVTGNVKDLLPLLVEGANKIKEVDGGIKFLNVKEFLCPGPNVTEYDGGKNNTKSLPVEQLIEFHKRTDEMYDAVIKENARSVRLLNLVLENINTTTMNEEQLNFLHFKKDFFSGDITLKNSNLSKIDMKGVQGQTADTAFEEIVLPRNMMKSSIKNLTLKNVTFPKEEFYKIGTFEDLPYVAPNIGTLTIYGEVKNSPLKDLTQEQIEKLKNDKYRPREMPSVYKGSQEIYDRLKYIYRGESHTKEFGNLHGSIQKPQDTFLALVSKNNSRG